MKRKALIILGASYAVLVIGAAVVIAVEDETARRIVAAFAGFLIGKAAVDLWTAP